MNTLQSGLGKMKWSREITITTDGHNRGGVLDEEKGQNEVILREYNPENRIFVNWFRIEEEDEWKDINKIVKANPSIIDPSFASLRQRIQQEIVKMPFTPNYFRNFLQSVVIILSQTHKWQLQSGMILSNARKNILLSLQQA